MNQDLQKTYQQINNLENIIDKSDNTVCVPDKNTLDNLHANLKTLNNIERNIFLSQIANIEGINAKNKKFSTMRNEQRTFLLEKLNERVIEIKKKLDNIEIIAKDA